MALIKLLKVGPNGIPRQHNTTTDELSMLTLEGGNIKLQNNEIISVNTDGNINLNPDGNGLVQINSAYTLPGADGTADQVLSTDGAGTVSFVTPFASILKKTMTAEVSIAIRDVVYVSSADNVSPADASAEATSRALGFAEAAATATNPVAVITQGIVSGFTGLTVGARYFLSETAGAITSTPPSTDEAAVIQVGYATSTTSICVAVQPISEIDTD